MKILIYNGTLDSFFIIKYKKFSNVYNLENWLQVTWKLRLQYIPFNKEHFWCVVSLNMFEKKFNENKNRC